MFEEIPWFYYQIINNELKEEWRLNKPMYFWISVTSSLNPLGTRASKFYDVGPPSVRQAGIRRLSQLRFFATNFFGSKKLLSEYKLKSYVLKRYE